ncbi:MAG: hypothetical protein DMF98_02920 [Acidobacteria bacterium]|nr:MAG: hypothetical protein DMF98_02920 [Acidobacteriota bacterium]
MENVTIERRGRKGRKVRQNFFAAFAAFAFNGGVSMFDLPVSRCALETFAPVVHAFVARSC